MEEDSLKELGMIALEAGLSRGADAEVYLMSSRQLSIEVADNLVETLKESEECGLGIRLIKGDSLGFAYTSDLTPPAILEAVKDAYRITDYTSADEYNCLPSGKYEYQDMQIYDAEISSALVENKIEIARQVEKAARQIDGRVSIVERAGYKDVEHTTLIMNTNGMYASGRGNYSGIYIYLAAEERGDVQTGFAMSMCKWFKDLHPQKVGIEGAANAIRKLHARNISSAIMPCVMEPYVVTQFLSILSRMVNGETVQKRKSLLAGKLGHKIAATCFNLVDDATRTDGTAGFPFDDEGVPSRCNQIIDQGILSHYLYDNYTAAREGVISTGNARRASFRSLPAVGSTNFMVLPGNNSNEALIADIGKGLYITEVMGMHTANPISGDFSVGTAGIMIEKGLLTFPVRGITIAGNMVDLLQNIDAVGSNMRFYGSKAAPAIRLKSLNISG